MRATDLSSLPARSLDGKIRTFSFSSLFTTRPADHLTLTARFRRYDLRNNTPRIAFPLGYVRFDAVWEDIPRISVPYGNTTDAFTASAAYDFGSSPSREATGTTSGTGRSGRPRAPARTWATLKADLRPSDWIVVRGSFEKGSARLQRPGDREERARLLPRCRARPSTCWPSTPATVCPGGTICNLRFDQSKKRLDRYGAFVELSPGGKASLTFSYIKGKDRYTESLFGLIRADNEAISAEVDYTPHERVNLFAFYTRENISTFQRGRQSGATVSVNPLDDWTSEIEDKVDSLGAGATFGLVKETVELTLNGNYQRVDGNNDFAAPSGARPSWPGGPRAGSPTSRSSTTRSSTRCRRSWPTTSRRRSGVGLGGWYEQYKLRDLNSNDISGGVLLTNYVPGSFFLAANDHDYKAHVLYVRASYLW